MITIERVVWVLLILAFVWVLWDGHVHRDVPEYCYVTSPNQYTPRDCEQYR